MEATYFTSIHVCGSAGDTLDSVTLRRDMSNWTKYRTRQFYVRLKDGLGSPSMCMQMQSPPISLRFVLPPRKAETAKPMTSEGYTTFDGWSTTRCDVPRPLTIRA